MTDSKYLQAALVLSGSVLSGTMMAFSFIAVPVVLDSTRDAKQLHRQWFSIYYAGFPVLPTISVATSSLYLFTAIRRRMANKSWLGCAVAGLTTVAMVPFTWVFMVPTNHTLLQLEADTSAGTSGDMNQALSLVKFWNVRHLTRSFFPLIGAMLGLKDLLDRA